MHRLTIFIVLQALSVSLALEPRKEEPTKLKNETLVRKFLKQLEIPENIYSTTVMIRVSKENKLEQFQEYIDHIKKTGVEVIKNTSKQILQEFKPNKNITQDVDSVTEIYEKKIENYATQNYMTLLKSHSVVDEVYMFLDVLNNAYRYLLREQRKKFHDMAPAENITNADYSTQNRALNVYGIIFRQSVNFKKGELLYICNNHQICKPYSAFSLRFLSFLSEVMALDDDQFKKFLEFLNEIITDDEDFLQLINANENIIKNLNSVFAHAGNFKESLEVLRALLVHRYKMIHIPNPIRKRKVQAMRILLDTLEKVLSFDHDKQIDMNFDVAITAVKKWGKLSIHEEEDESADDISDFINSIFKALCRSGDYYTQNLIDTILTGRIVEEEEYKDLFRDGYKNVYAAEE